MTRDHHHLVQTSWPMAEAFNIDPILWGTLVS